MCYGLNIEECLESEDFCDYDTVCYPLPKYAPCNKILTQQRCLSSINYFEKSCEWK